MAVARQTALLTVHTIDLTQRDPVLWSSFRDNGWIESGAPTDNNIDNSLTGEEMGETTRLDWLERICGRMRADGR